MIEATIYFERYLAWKKRVSATAGQQGGLCYESYTAMEPDMLQHDADMGNPAALEELGERYLFGVSPFPRDIDQAQSLLAEAAQGGHPDAAALLAELCRTDQFGRRDPARYPALLERAAQAGSWRAMYHLAQARYLGQDGFDSDPSAALDWSLQCHEMTGNLIAAYFAHPCTQSFDEYFSSVYDAFVQSLCAAAKQIIDGKGCEASYDRAGELAYGAQEFHKTHFGEENGKFSSLIHYCARKLEEQDAQN